jgi:hypothetical protein
MLGAGSCEGTIYIQFERRARERGGERERERERDRTEREAWESENRGFVT